MRASKARAGYKARILIPSIGDPLRAVNGASTYTRELVRWLQAPPLEAEPRVLPLPALTPVRHRLRQASSLARSLVSKLPSKTIFASSAQMSTAVQSELRKQRYDLVLINGADLLWLLDELPRALPRAVVAHNIEHRLFHAQVRSARWLPARLRKLLDSDARRLEQYELNGMKRAGNVIFLSAENAAYAEQRCAGLRTLVLPPAFGYPPYPRRSPPRESEPLEVGFLGNFGWWPNRQGLGWLLDRVFPHTKDLIRLHLFGEGSKNGIAQEGVTAHGYVPDLAEVFGRCHFMICPVLAGGGVSIKAAEAIYNRVPILATPFGVRGLLLAADPAIVIRETVEDWVSFLRSPAAHQLARRNIAQANSQRFCHDARKDELQGYVLGVLGPDEAVA